MTSSPRSSSALRDVIADEAGRAGDENHAVTSFPGRAPPPSVYTPTGAGGGTPSRCCCRLPVIRLPRAIELRHLGGQPLDLLSESSYSAIFRRRKAYVTLTFSSMPFGVRT